jgi:hypothetical protein
MLRYEKEHLESVLRGEAVVFRFLVTYVGPSGVEYEFQGQVWRQLLKQSQTILGQQGLHKPCTKTVTAIYDYGGRFSMDDGKTYRVGDYIEFVLQPEAVMNHTNSNNTLARLGIEPMGKQKDEPTIRKLYEVYLVNKKTGQVQHSTQLATSTDDAKTAAAIEANIPAGELGDWVKQALAIMDVPEVE